MIEYFRSLLTGVYRSLFPGNTLKNKEFKMINFTAKLRNSSRNRKLKVIFFLSSSQRLKGELTEKTLNGAIFSQISYHCFAVGFLTDQTFTFTIASLTLKLVRGRYRRSWRGRVSSASESQSSVSG